MDVSFPPWHLIMQDPDHSNYFSAKIVQRHLLDFSEAVFTISLCAKRNAPTNWSYGDVALRGGPPTIYSNAQPYNNNNSATCDVITTSLTYCGDK